MFRLNVAIKIIHYQTLKIQKFSHRSGSGIFWNCNFVSDDVGQCHPSFLLNCWVFPFDKFSLTRQNPVFSVDKLLVCYWQEIHYMQLWSWCFHRECTKLLILCYNKVKWKQKSWFCQQCGVDLKPLHSLLVGSSTTKHRVTPLSTAYRNSWPVNNNTGSHV